MMNALLLVTVSVKGDDISWITILNTSEWSVFPLFYFEC